MRWYHFLILVILLVAAFAAGYGFRWFTSPLGCPLCLCTEQALLPPEYKEYWGEFIALVTQYGRAAAIGLLTLIGIGLIGVGELYAIYRTLRRQE